jgi:glycosyltransferase involved in cell wall biosynthesis
MSELVLMLSAAHPADDVRIVGKEGAALAAAGHRVVHLAPGDPPATRLHGVELLSHGPKRGWLGRMLGIPLLAWRAVKLQPTVIHAHEPDAWIAARIAAWRCKARVVLDVHEHYPSRLDGKLHWLLRPLARAAISGAMRLIAHRADAVIVAKDGLDRAFGGPERCTKVRNYGADPGVAPRRHQEGPLRLLLLGALGADRGAFTMLRAMEKLRDRSRLVVIGRFTDGSEAAFDVMAGALGVADRIERHGWLPYREALDQAACCDIALVLFQPGVENHRLALPHKLFDAMLCGLPVIVPNFSEEVAGIVASAGCGVAIDTSDTSAIADSVRRLSDPALRERMGAVGRAAALSRFAWSGEAERLVSLYRRLMEQPEAKAQPAPAPAVPVAASGTSLGGN